MQIFRTQSDFPNWLKGGALTIGNFDGVHQGHARIVKQLNDFARQISGKSIVFTFEPHPVRLLRPDEVPPPLTWTERKAELLEELGVDALVAYPTDLKMLAKTPSEFFDEVICQSLQAKAVVEGPNFFYGHNRAGNIETLAESCATTGILFKVVEPLKNDYQMVSSSRIRAAIRDGDVDAAANWLTQPYRIRGIVTHGAGRGSKIGFPTANLAGIDTLVPANGIYAGRANFKGRSFAAAVHIGPNPTFGEHVQKTEVYVLDYSDALYGETMEVDFLSRLRGIVNFDGVDQLVQQMKIDVAQVRSIVENKMIDHEDTQYAKSKNAEETINSDQDGRALVSIDWGKLQQIIDVNQRFLLVSHVRPDCDALGSELGMALVLRSLGKQVRIVNGDETPDSLDFIDPEHEIKTVNLDVKPDELEDVQVAIILDTSAWGQLGPMADWIKSTKAQVVIVDHHIGEDDFDAILFKDESAESTGRLVVEAAEALGVELTREMATPLFAAMATDTGWFRFPSAGSISYRAAARLIDAGASPPEIYGALYEQQTIGRLRLRGRALDRIETEFNGRLIYTYIVNSDFEETGAIRTDTENLINLSLEVEGTMFAIIFVQQEDGGFKLSFRSRCDLLANEVAANFGGGGHKAAAGARVEGTLEQVRQQVLTRVRTEFAGLTA